MFYEGFGEIGYGEKTSPIFDMTREELRDIMLVSGELERFKRTPNWEKAFEMYILDTGDKQVSPQCGTCFKKVKNWLTR